MSVFLHGHHGQCGSNHIVANRGILFQPPCLLVLSRLVDNRTLNGAVVRKPVCVTCRDLRTCPSSAGRFTTQARLLACLQVVPVCSQLSRNEAFSHFKKRSFYIIPRKRILPSPADSFLHQHILPLQSQSICDKTCRAGSGGGLPVFREAKCAVETRSVSEGTLADCGAIERTSEAKCPQRGANEPRQTVR